MKIKELVYIIIYSLLFIIISTISNTRYFSILHYINLSILPLLISSYHLGIKKTLIVSIFSIMFLFIFGHMYTSSIIELILKYILGYSIFSVSCHYYNIKYFYTGILFTNTISYILSFISDYIVYNGHIIESIIYNTLVYVPTLIVSLILIPIVIKILIPIYYKR